MSATTLFGIISCASAMHAPAMDLPPREPPKTMMVRSGAVMISFCAGERSASGSFSFQGAPAPFASASTAAGESSTSALPEKMSGHVIRCSLTA